MKEEKDQGGVPNECSKWSGEINTSKYENLLKYPLHFTPLPPTNSDKPETETKASAGSVLWRRFQKIRESLWREKQKQVIYVISRCDGYSWLSGMSEVNYNPEIVGTLVIRILRQKDNMPSIRMLRLEDIGF